MPIDDKNQSSSIVSITGETVQLYYLNSGVLTTDAGQAAGVAVIAQLAYNNVKNAIGSMEAVKGDTSLSFTSTALTTEAGIDWSTIESVDDQTLANRIAAITDSLENGEFVVDYTHGTIYGKKASTQTALTSAAYKVLSGVSSGGTVVTENVNLSKVAGNTTNAGAGNVGTGTLRVTLANDDTNAAAIKTAVELLDDTVKVDDTGTFTPGTDKAIMVGGLVDDVATDTADEGDAVAARFSARRAMMTSLDTRLDQTNDAIRIYANTAKDASGTAYVPLVDTDGHLQVDVLSAPSTVVTATDLDIRDLTNASDSVAIYGSDDGGTTKRIIKTDSGGAIQVDLEVASVDITGGQAADGAAVSGNPVRIGGKDGSGNTQDIITDTDGHLQIDVLSAPSTVVTATDLDIRDLASATDSVTVKSATAADCKVEATIATSVRPAAPSNVNTVAYAASLVVKNAAGTCYEVRGHNSGAAQFVQVHDASSLPADAEVPEDIIYVAANTSFSITYPEGKAFATGIVVCNSSTGPTKTIGGADLWISAEYV
jgi:hypothetical protein